MKGLVNEKQPTEESNDPVGDYMNYNKSKYRRRNYEPELKNQPKELEGGPYYIRIDGKIFKDRDGKPVMFNGKKHANAVALKMMQKDFNKGKVFTLSIKPEDKQDGIDEELDEGLIDKAVVGAAKYAVPAITRSLPAIAKAGAKAGGKLGTRAGVAVAKKIGTSAMSAGRLGKELGAVAGQYAAGAGASAAAKRLAAAAAARKEPKLVNSPDDIIDEGKTNHVYLNKLKSKGQEPKKVATIQGRVTSKHLSDLAAKHKAKPEDFEWGNDKWNSQFTESMQIDEMTPERKRALMTALDKIDAHKDYLHGKYGVNKPGEKTPPDRRETLLALRKAATDYRQATKADKESRKIQEGTMTQGIFDPNPRKAKMALQGLNNLLRDALPASQAADILHRYVYDDELLDLIDALALRKHDADIRTDRGIMDRIEYLRSEAEGTNLNEGYTLKKVFVDKYVVPGDADDYVPDMKAKDVKYQIINNKTGQVVGFAELSSDDYFGHGSLLIKMKNGAQRYLNLQGMDPQAAINKFIKNPKTSAKYTQIAEVGNDPILNKWRSSVVKRIKHASPEDQKILNARLQKAKTASDFEEIHITLDKLGVRDELTQIDEGKSYSTVQALVQKFYDEHKINSRKQYLDIKHPGMRVWTRGDGTRYRDPGGISDEGYGKQAKQFWNWLGKLPGVKHIGKVSGEFASSPFNDAYVYGGLYFSLNDYGNIQWGSISRLRNTSIWRQAKENVEMNEAQGSLDPETALRQARNITKAIKYDNTATDIIVKIQMLAEQVAGLDLETLKYSVENVHQAQSALESAVYGLEEAFDDLLTQAQNSEEGLDEAKQRLDAKCWSGYKKQGTKMKGGVRVNNCVPAKESAILKGLKR